MLYRHPALPALLAENVAGAPLELLAGEIRPESARVNRRGGGDIAGEEVASDRLPPVPAGCQPRLQVLATAILTAHPCKQSMIDYRRLAELGDRSKWCSDQGRCHASQYRDRCELERRRHESPGQGGGASRARAPGRDPGAFMGASPDSGSRNQNFAQPLGWNRRSTTPCCAG